MAIIRRTFPGANASQPNLIMVAGRVAIGATGAVGASVGKLFTVTRTAAGLYTVTLDSSGAVPAIVYAAANLVFATGSDTQTVSILTLDATNKKITLQVNDAGTVDTAADPPSGSILQFLILVQNTVSVG